MFRKSHGKSQMAYICQKKSQMTCHVHVISTIILKHGLHPKYKQQVCSSKKLGFSNTMVYTSQTVWITLCPHFPIRATLCSRHPRAPMASRHHHKQSPIDKAPPTASNVCTIPQICKYSRRRSVGAQEAILGKSYKAH